MTIIGNGCENIGTSGRTYISSKRINHLGSEQGTGLIINASNVTVEGLYCQALWIRNVSNTHLKNCDINRLYASHTHRNTVIDQCHVNSNYTVAKGENLCFKNSFIYSLYGGESSTDAYGKRNTPSNLAYFTNCVIDCWCDYYETSSGSYRNQKSTVYGIYKNCILGYRNYSYSYEGTGYKNNPNYWQGYVISTYFGSGVWLYNNVFFLYPYKYDNGSQVVFEDMKNIEMNLQEDTETFIGNTSSTWAKLFDDDANNWWEKLNKDLPYKGDDDTVVGPYGGTGFSIYPSIPRIVESKIDSNTDADGLLNVKIKVEVNP